MSQKAETAEKIRLLIIDDHTLFREGLARLLEAEDDLALIGHFSSSVEALASPELTTAYIALLDFDLGEEPRLHFIRESRKLGFSGKIIMVTAGMTHIDAALAVENGASGIFLKHNPPADLILAIRKVAQGETWFEATLLDLRSSGSSNQPGPQAPLPFNQREQSVLKGVFEGLSNKEIGAQLEISESYVKALLQQLFAKTGVRTRSQLVRVALERRIEYGHTVESDPSRKIRRG
jgi:DNA-binding NarL/FixJ family response regulator